MREVVALVDSALDKNPAMSHHQPPRPNQVYAPPDVMPRVLRLDGVAEGRPVELARVPDNHQRLVRLPVGRTLESIRLTVEATWGAPATRLYAFSVG